jgi:hypothetical protein
MSTPTTNYICLNGSGIYQDLSGIFQPYASGTQANATGFKLSNNADLSTIFAPNTGSNISFNTNFIAANGQDLRLIFAPKT